MKPLKVLLVDDAAFTRDLVRKSVRYFYPSFHCDEASDGDEAQKMMQKNSYDLVLSDWEMPKMTGLELLEWARNNEATAKVPFVMITSRGDKDHVIKAIELKANNYLVKPFSNEKFGKVVSGVITKAFNLTQEELVRLGGTKNMDALTGGNKHGFSAALKVSSDIGKNIPTKAAFAATSFKPSGKLLIPMRTSGGSQIQILLKEMSVENVVGVIKSGDHVPAIQEQVVIDVQAGGVVARINGYVHMLEARDGGANADFVNIIIVSVDQDDQSKRKQVELYIKEKSSG